MSVTFTNLGKSILNAMVKLRDDGNPTVTCAQIHSHLNRPPGSNTGSAMLSLETLGFVERVSPHGMTYSWGLTHAGIDAAERSRP